MRSQLKLGEEEEHIRERREERGERREGREEREERERRGERGEREEREERGVRGERGEERRERERRERVTLLLHFIIVVKYCCRSLVYISRCCRCPITLLKHSPSGQGNTSSPDHTSGSNPANEKNHLTTTHHVQVLLIISRGVQHCGSTGHGGK